MQRDLSPRAFLAAALALYLSGCASDGTRYCNHATRCTDAGADVGLTDASDSSSEGASSGTAGGEGTDTHDEALGPPQEGELPGQSVSSPEQSHTLDDSTLAIGVDASDLTQAPSPDGGATILFDAAAPLDASLHPREAGAQPGEAGLERREAGTPSAMSPPDATAQAEDPTSSDGLPTPQATDVGTTDSGATNQDPETTPVGEADGSVELSASDDGSTEPSLPAGSCLEAPVAPSDGSYPDCEQTSNAGTCTIACTEEWEIGGFATCVDGTWKVAECVLPATLDVVVRDATRSRVLDGAIVYVVGYFNPDTEVCIDSEYCRRAGTDGIATFETFPSGLQFLMVEHEGYEKIATPIETSPWDERLQRLPALPTGFLNDALAIVATSEPELEEGEEQPTDLSLLLNVPVTGTDGGSSDPECVGRLQEGSFAAAPFAVLDYHGPNLAFTDTIRVALNDQGTGPYYNGTYNVVVVVPGGFHAGNDLRPAVRVFKRTADGVVHTTLLTSPDYFEERFNAWHVFDLLGDGEVLPRDITEDEQFGSFTVPCVDEVYGY